MKISYCITVCNEHEELDRLLKQLTSLSFINDHEIVIQYDIEKVTVPVMDVIALYKKEVTCRYVITGTILNNNFSQFKNNLIKFVTGDWIIQLDADEYLANNLANYLPELLKEYEDLDLIAISRINIVNGLTRAHIQQWGWQVYDSPLGKCIQYPDLQTRIYKNNPNIKWVNPVHERITGFKTYTELIDFDWSLIHIKDVKRQEKQNEFYSKNF